MNEKPGRKRKANTAKTLVEIHRLKSANSVKRGNSFNIIGQGESKKLLLVGSVSRRSGDPLFGYSRDRVKQDNSKPIAFIRGRRTIRISDLSTRW